MKAVRFLHSILVPLILLSLALSACATATPATAPSGGQDATVGEAVTLTLGSWRVDDAEQWATLLGKFHEAYPNITVRFDPTNPPEYNATLRQQLEAGTGPDLMFLRSFTTSRQLYDAGYLEPLDALPGINDNFTAEMRVPWATDDGKPYGIPVGAVSHGIYYNIDIFKANNIAVPTTWEDLIKAAKTLKDAGITPFSNATGEAWTMAEVVWMNIAPGFIGGVDGRMAYLNGERCFNDPAIVSVFQAMADMAPYLPAGQEALTSYDSQQLFIQGKAAMYLDGSWDIPSIEKDNPNNWSVFATPPPAGKKAVVAFHLDYGMGVNAASKHKPEAELFLQWMMTTEFGKLFGDLFPGFFPISKNPAPALSNKYADAFLKLNDGRGTDIRFVWEKLMDVPSGFETPYNIIQNDSIAIVAGSMTPQAAADQLQTETAKWYEPAKTCGK